MLRWLRREDEDQEDAPAEEAGAEEVEAGEEDAPVRRAEADAGEADAASAPAEAETPPPADLEAGLSRTRRGFFSRIGDLFRRGSLEEEDWEEVEALLIQADVGVEATLKLVDRLRQRVQEEVIRDGDELRQALADEMRRILEDVDRSPPLPQPGVPYVVLTVGVNGVGKTTTIAKLAHHHRRQGRSVLLAAADTFRAAAIEQLQIWGERAGVPVLAHNPGADPGAVAYDAITAALSRQIDVVIVDTAGRLHTKHNLMQELQKIRRVIAGKLPPAPQEVLLVIDATTGQNGLAQARVFTSAVQVTHLALAKLDGTAKGGIAFAIAHELDLPIAYVGTGERLEDLAEFDAQRFVAALLET